MDYYVTVGTSESSMAFKQFITAPAGGITMVLYNSTVTGSVSVAGALYGTFVEFVEIR
jgi:hypothetical protein